MILQSFHMIGESGLFVMKLESGYELKVSYY